MSRRPKDIGTWGETLVARWLRDNGYPDAERRALAGNADQGDILATRGLVLEVKAGAQTRNPGDTLLDKWVRQADAEAASAHAICLLVLQRHGTRDASRWWVVERGAYAGYVWRELGDALHHLPTHLQPQPPTEEDVTTDRDLPRHARRLARSPRNPRPALA